MEQYLNFRTSLIPILTVSFLLIAVGIGLLIASNRIEEKTAYDPETFFNLRFTSIIMLVMGIFELLYVGYLLIVSSQQSFFLDKENYMRGQSRT